MENPFYHLILVYLSFMTLGIVIQFFLINKGKDKKESWKKFIFFNLIIFSLILCYHFIPYFLKIAFVLISLGGLLELFSITRDNPAQFRLTSILFYVAIFSLFVFGAFSVSKSILIQTFALVAVFDGYSQLGGKWIGKRKLAFKISPNKTWEGFVIGLITCYSFGLALFLLDSLSIYYFLFAIPILAVSGDLIASSIKRKSKVKDFSNLIPYQGGIMDRFDSYVFTVSVLSLISYLFL